jgi:hypothetical protein
MNHPDDAVMVFTGDANSEKPYVYFIFAAEGHLLELGSGGCNYDCDSCRG